MKKKIMSVKGDTYDQLRGKWAMSKNIVVPSNEIEKQARALEEEKKAEELAQRLKETHEAKQKEIMEKINELELVPYGNRVVLMPYPSNPYTQVITESGIYIETSGRFVNPDTGELDRMEILVACAKVIEAGPECKYVKVGDDVYFDNRVAYPLPFMSLGYKLVSEGQILAIINSDLKKRFNME